MEVGVPPDRNLRKGASRAPRIETVSLSGRSGAAPDARGLPVVRSLLVTVTVVSIVAVVAVVVPVVAVVVPVIAVVVAVVAVVVPVVVLVVVPYPSSSSSSYPSSSSSS